MAVQTTLSGIWGTNIITLNYGILYNWYAAADARNIANTGWHCASYTNWKTLIFYLDVGAYEEVGVNYKFVESDIAGGKLKETGLTHWNSPNTDATNEVGFNCKGTGSRLPNGTFNLFNTIGAFVFTDITSFTYYSVYAETNSGLIVLESDNLTSEGKRYGQAIRLIKDSTSLTHGQTGTYTGNDGKVYNTICIGTQEWISINLKETKYRDLSDIPEVTVAGTWAGLTTGALCLYNNDWSNL